MKNFPVCIILCIALLTAALVAGCTGGPGPTATNATTTSTATPGAAMTSMPLPPGVSKPATAVTMAATAGGDYALGMSGDKGYFAVPKDSTIQMTLDENPTTGYVWTLTLTPGLEIITDSYSGSGSQLAGAGGTHIWQIKAIKAGEQQITGILKRPSDKITGAETTYTAFVSVT